MNYTGHIIFSLVLLIPAAFVLRISDAWPFIAVGVASSLLPDIDHPKSKISSFVKQFVLLPTGLYLSYLMFRPCSGLDWLYLAIVGLLLFFVISTMVNLLRPRHRGITHTYLALLSFSVLVFILSRNVELCVSAALGYFSHLIADKTFKVL